MSKKDINNDHDSRFEVMLLAIPTNNSRLKELQNKSVKHGLRGDEVFEFIHLDRLDLTKEIESLKSEVNKLKVDVQEDKFILCHTIKNNFCGPNDRARLINFIDIKMDTYMAKLEKLRRGK